MPNDAACPNLAWARVRSVAAPSCRHAPASHRLECAADNAGHGPHGHGGGPAAYPNCGALQPATAWNTQPARPTMAHKGMATASPHPDRIVPTRRPPAATAWNTQSTMSTLARMGMAVGAPSLALTCAGAARVAAARLETPELCVRAWRRPRGHRLEYAVGQADLGPGGHGPRRRRPPAPHSRAMLNPADSAVTCAAGGRAAGPATPAQALREEPPLA